MENTKSPKLAFYYCLALVTLIIGSISFGGIVFEFVNKFFPLVSKSYYGENSALKFAISGTVISFPIFYFMKFSIYKGIKKGEFDINSSVRKWLTYFIVFVSSVVVVGALIVLLNNFLNGETTVNFLLKTLAVLIVSSSIFTFYLYDIKRKDISGKFNLVYFIISALVILTMLICSFFIIESPTEARAKKLDQKIIGNFENIKRGIEMYYQYNKKLPSSLDDLKNQNYDYVDTNEFLEESTGKYYGYNIIEERKFELCANFNTSNIDEKEESGYSYINWRHEKGYWCVSKTIDGAGK